MFVHESRIGKTEITMIKTILWGFKIKYGTRQQNKKTKKALKHPQLSPDQ